VISHYHLCGEAAANPPRVGVDPMPPNPAGNVTMEFIGMQTVECDKNTPNSRELSASELGTTESLGLPSPSIPIALPCGCIVLTPEGTSTQCTSATGDCDMPLENAVDSVTCGERGCGQAFHLKCCTGWLVSRHGICRESAGFCGRKRRNHDT